jgi:hypothetical protein
MTPEETNRRIEEVFADPRRVQAALALGVADARREYAAHGVPMAAWKDNKVVWLDPITLTEVSAPDLAPTKIAQ